MGQPYTPKDETPPFKSVYPDAADIQKEKDAAETSTPEPVENQEGA
jgi:hypothetical protein